MQVANKAIEEMLKNADPQSRKVMANILTGKIVANIFCLSEDQKSKREVPVLDEDNQPVFYKSGKNKGQAKTTSEEYISREGCKGRLIGRVYDNGRVEPVVSEDGNMYLRATRQRLDGVIGCECWCGQDSRISAQEAGHIDYSGGAPSKEGLESIFKNVQKNPTAVEIKNGRTEIDGFAFEEIR